MSAYVNEINARIDYERSKNAANDSIVDTLNSVAKTFAHETIANVLIASNVSASIVNRQERINARFNVYSLEKIENIARNICAVASLNHYTLAILKSAVALEASERKLTHRDAVCACSASVKHTDSQREKILKSTRYAKHTSANTASTQASSSLNALVAFNVLSEARDEANNATYSVNRESHAFTQLSERNALA